MIALASLCLQHLELLPTLLCDGRDVLRLLLLLAALFPLQTANFDKDVLRGGSAVPVVSHQWFVQILTKSQSPNSKRGPGV